MKKLLTSIAMPLCVTAHEGQIQTAKAESGRIWWMYDRGPDGSADYIRELFPDDQFKQMKYNAQKNVWTVEIGLEANDSNIDFFSNHRKTIHYKSKDYPAYISSPYTRLQIATE